MPTSMYYISILIIFSLFSLSGCSQQSRPDYIDNSVATKEVTNNPEFEIQLYQQAITHINDNEFNMAEQILLDFTKKRPQLAGPWANLGLIQLKRDNIDKAEDLLKTALEKSPAMAQTHNLLGLIEIKKGNIKQAEFRYLQALHYKDDYALAHHNLGLLYDIYLQNIEKAVNHYQRYLELIDYSDETTANWVEELKLSLEIKTS